MTDDLTALAREILERHAEYEGPPWPIMVRRENALAAIIEALTTREPMSEEWAAEREQMRWIIRQYVDPFEVAPQYYAIVLSIGTGDTHEPLKRKEDEELKPPSPECNILNSTSEVCPRCGRPARAYHERQLCVIHAQPLQERRYRGTR